MNLPRAACFTGLLAGTGVAMILASVLHLPPALAALFGAGLATCGVGLGFLAVGALESLRCR